MADHAQSGSMQTGGFRGFLQRRLAEAMGAALVILGLALLLSFLSASAGDPSFNRAVDQPTRNLMGPIGAYIADFTLQGLGLGVFILFAAPIAWGWRLIRDRALPRWWLRLALVPVAALLLSMATAGLPNGDGAKTTAGVSAAVSPAWPWKAGLGGFAGHLLIDGTAGLNSGLAANSPAGSPADASVPTAAMHAVGGLSGMLSTLGVPPLLGSASLLPASLSGLLALVTLYFALGIGLHSYLRFGRNVASAGRQVGLVIERRRRDLVAVAPTGRRDASAPSDRGMEDAATPWYRRLFAVGGGLVGGDRRRQRQEPHFAADDEPQSGQRSRLGPRREARLEVAEQEAGSGFAPASLQQPSIRTRNLVAPPREKQSGKTAKRAAAQPSLALDESNFELPPHDLLARPAANAAVQRINEESLEKNARLLRS